MIFHHYGMVHHDVSPVIMCKFTQKECIRVQLGDKNNSSECKKRNTRFRTRLFFPSKKIKHRNYLVTWRKSCNFALDFTFMYFNIMSNQLKFQNNKQINGN